MELSEIELIENEEERVVALYNEMDEDKRLKHKKSSWVEFLVLMTYLQKYIKAGSEVLDLGADTGIYSLELAKRECQVTAIDLSKKKYRYTKAKSKRNKFYKSICWKRHKFTKYKR